MKSRWLVSALALVILSGLILSHRLTTSSRGGALLTYFDYTPDELASLRGLASKQQITPEDLYKWDDTAFDLVSKNTLVTGFDPNTSIIYAYLLVAQRDAAFLSFNAKRTFAGSIAPASREVLCLFFRNACSVIGSDEETDGYSDALAQIVLRKVKARILEDDRMVRPYQSKTGPQYWLGPEPMIGLADGSRKTWFIESGSQFRAPPPPSHDSTAFKEELANVKEGLASLDDKRRKAVISWAGGPGTKTPPGQLIEIADEYMRAKGVPLEKVLLVRSTLAMTIADAVIAVFDSKYTYWVKRPFMMDRSIRTVMPTPNHPSYPAGHSTLSAAAATILSHYFPEARDTWQALAREAGLSRVWGGIHFPMDNEQGLILGDRVAREAIRQLQMTRSKSE